MTVAAIFIILEVAALGMLKYNGALQNRWISKGMHGFMAAVWGGTESVAEYFRLKKTNEELIEENDFLIDRLRRYEHLTGIHPDSLSGTSSGNYVYIPASISKISNNKQHNYIIIDKGYEDGVTPHSGIVTRNGAVGIVDEVSRHYSYARSFANTDMSVSTRIGREGVTGIMRWDGKSSRTAVLSEIPQHIVLEKGDTVYTSGYSEIFPPDIPLGTIRNWKTVNGATYNLDIELFTDFRSLRHVYIVNNLYEQELKELEHK